MLDSKLKQAYQKITPSPDLKQKILSMHVEPQERKRAVVLRMKPIATIAACAVLLLGGVMLTSRMQHLGQSEIVLQGDVVLDKQELIIVPKIVEDGAVAVTPRVASVAPATHTEKENNVAIDLSVNLRRKTEISVEQGSLYIGSELQGEENLEQVGQHVFAGEEDGMTLIRWVIPVTDEDAEYRMTIGKEIVCVNYSALTNEYSISRKCAES
jgi:hypothetical protein